MLYLLSTYRAQSTVQWLHSASSLLLVFLLGTFLTGCSLFTADTASPVLQNPTGVSGVHNPEAEQLFAKAHVLWGRDELCSDPEKALDYLDRALELEPDYAEALMRRALAENQLGYFDDAFDDATRAIRLSPTPQNYAFRGYVLLMQRQSAGARADIDHALQQDASLYRAWNFLAAVNLLDGDTEAACASFVKACSNGDCRGLEAARKEKVCK